MKSPPLVRPAMLVSLLALSAALPPTPRRHLPAIATGPGGWPLARWTPGPAALPPTPRRHLPAIATGHDGWPLARRTPGQAGLPPTPQRHVFAIATGPDGRPLARRTPGPAALPPTPQWHVPAIATGPDDISPLSPFSGIPTRHSEELTLAGAEDLFRRPVTTVLPTTAHLTTVLPTTAHLTTVLPTTVTSCDTQLSPLPADQALYQKPAVTTCAKSCKQLRDQGGSQPNGVYWFTGMPVPTFCDFTLDSGGWTLLLVATTTDGWGPLSVHGRNEYSPSLTDNYSILKLADAIRNLASGGRFNYRIEAQAQKGRQHWGGVWDVPRDYSFVAESPSQNDVNIVRKFDTWSYSDDGIEQRMPWLYAGSGVPVLTIGEAR